MSSLFGLSGGELLAIGAGAILVLIIVLSSLSARGNEKRRLAALPGKFEAQMDELTQEHERLVECTQDAEQLLQDGNAVWFWDAVEKFSVIAANIKEKLDRTIETCSAYNTPPKPKLKPEHPIHLQIPAEYIESVEAWIATLNTLYGAALRTGGDFAIIFEQRRSTQEIKEGLQVAFAKIEARISIIHSEIVSIRHQANKALAAASSAARTASSAEQTASYARWTASSANATAMEVKYRR